MVLPQKQKNWDLKGFEYVNQLYKDVTEAKDKNSALKQFIAQSNAQAKVHGVENILIMIDGEGILQYPVLANATKLLITIKSG